MIEKADLDVTNDDGGDMPVSDGMLNLLKEAVDDIAAEGQSGFWLSRSEADNTRFALWDGQDPSGLKLAENNDNEPVKPFEGATDNRIRIADMLANEDVMLMVLSALRARLLVRGVTAKETGKARNMEIALRYFIRHGLGLNYVLEMIKAAQYSVGDSPGVALVKMLWSRRTQLVMQTVTLQDLAKLYVDQALEGADPNDPNLGPAVQAAAADFVQAMGDPLADEAGLADWLISAFPHLRKKRAKQVISNIRKLGTAEFPTPVEISNGPVIEAKRLYEEWFCSGSAPTDFQRLPIWFENMWLSKPEVLERQISEGWSQDFVDELLGVNTHAGAGVNTAQGHAGEAAFPEYVREPQTKSLVQRSSDIYKRLYNVLIGHFIAVNEDGIPGRYYVTFHKSVSVAAHERRLWDYPHGKWPGGTIVREVLGSRLMDSRGLSDIAGPIQSLIKLHCDLAGDNAIIGGLPPVLTRGRKNQGTLYLAALLEIPLKRDGDVKWMQPPQLPTSSEKMIAELRRQINEYHGRPGEGVDPSLVQIHREFKVALFNWQWREILLQLMQLIQAYAPADVLAQITDSDGQPLNMSPEDIRGQFDLDIAIDVRDMDPEFIEKKGQILRDIILATDREKVIQTAPAVEAMFYSLFPEVSYTAIRSVDQANMAELEAENKAYVEIRSGREPALPDDGSINYPLRLKMYQDMAAANPLIYNDMAPDKRAILQSRIQRLEVLSQQYGENVAIGRQGGRTALPEQMEG